MGHFIPGADEELFTDDFLDDISFRLVRHHVVGEIFRSFRQVFHDAVHQFIQIFAGFGRERHDFGKGIDFAVLHDFLQHCVFFDEVDFRKGQNDRHFPILQEGKDVTVSCPQRIVAGAEEYDEVHFIQSIDGALSDGFAQFVLGLVHARGIKEDHLGIVSVPDAGDFISCSLGMGGNDGNLLPQQRIHESGLPHIRPSHEGHKAGMEFVVIFCHRISCRNYVRLVYKIIYKYKEKAIGKFVVRCSLFVVRVERL